MRLVNIETLKDWLTKHRPRSKEKLAVNAEVSVSCLEKVLEGRAPRLENCIKIAQVTGIPLETLFPEVKKTA